MLVGLVTSCPPVEEKESAIERTDPETALAVLDDADYIRSNLWFGGMIASALSGLEV